MGIRQDIKDLRDFEPTPRKILGIAVCCGFVALGMWADTTYHPDDTQPPVIDSETQVPSPVTFSD